MLAWTNRVLGVFFPVDHHIVKHFRQMPSLHAPLQQSPYEMREAVHWEHLLTSDNAFIVNIAAAVVITMYGTMRYKHLTYSALLGYTDRMLIGVCKRDKTKTEASGEREGFVWLVPANGLSVWLMGKLIFDVWNKRMASLGKTNLQCIAFDFGPGADISAANFFTKRPLPMGKFVQCAKQLLLAPPLCASEEEANSASYRGRRFMSTAALEIPLPDIERAALGNWKGQVGDSGTLWKLAGAMSVRYSDLRLQLAARAKFKCLEALRVASLAAGTFALPWENYKRWMPTNEVLEAKAGTVGEGISDIVLEASGKPKCLPKDFPLVPGQFLEQGPKSAEDSDSDCVSASSSSTGSLTNATAVNELQMFENHVQLEWAIPPHKNALAHMVVSSDNFRLECLCGLKLLPRETGKGLRELCSQPNRVCPRCIARLEGDLAVFLSAR